MSRSFNGASGQHLDLTASLPLVVNTPMTMFIYGLANNLTAQKCLAALGTAGTTNQCLSLQLSTTGHAIARTRNTGNADAISSTAIGAGSYFSMMGAWGPGGNKRSIWLNGGGLVTETTNRPLLTDANHLTLGSEIDNSSGRMNGLEAYFALWAVELGAPEAAALAAGADPRSVAFPYMAYYFTLDTNTAPEPSPISSDTLTVTGTTYSATNPTIDPYVPPDVVRTPSSPLGTRRGSRQAG